MARDAVDQVRRSQERLKQRVYRKPVPNIYGQKYWYVFGYTKEGRTVIWGPYLTEKEADRELVKLEDGETFELETRDLNRATREIKAELIARGADPDDALRKVIHSKKIK